MQNLYVAGSSVFPTCANDMPTLTLMALAHRLADHIEARLQETCVTAPDAAWLVAADGGEESMTHA
jgi:choline dehydrogenase-like flavoprotein